MVDPNLKSVYSDNVEVNFSMYNINLVLSSVEEGKVIHLGNIKFSPQTAKLLAINLNNNVKAYEEIYGQIPSYTKDILKKEKIFNKNIEKIKEEALKEEAAFIKSLETDEVNLAPEKENVSTEDKENIEEKN